jgi:hypothetical protein
VRYRVLLCCADVDVLGVGAVLWKYCISELVSLSELWNFGN